MIGIRQRTYKPAGSTGSNEMKRNVWVCKSILAKVSQESICRKLLLQKLWLFAQQHDNGKHWEIILFKSDIFRWRDFKNTTFQKVVFQWCDFKNEYLLKVILSMVRRQKYCILNVIFRWCDFKKDNHRKTVNRKRNNRKRETRNRKQKTLNRIRGK